MQLADGPAMNKLARSSSLVVSSIAVLGLASLVGCGGVVTRGGDGGGGAGGESGGSGGVTGTTISYGGEGGGSGCDPAACPTPAVAMTHAQFEAAMGQDPNMDPPTDTYFLQYGDGVQAPTCSAPFGSYEGCGGWTASIQIASNLLTPGTYSFDGFNVDLYYTASFDEGAGQCSGLASAGPLAGELIIHSVDDYKVTFTVQNLDGTPEVPVQGYFVADRCPLLD